MEMSTFFTLWEVTAAVTLERIQIAIKMRKYTTILWDLDQTILDFARSQDYALRYTFCQFDKEIGEAEVSVYAAINDEHWKRMERGEITKEEVLLGRFIVLFDKEGFFVNSLITVSTANFALLMVVSLSYPSAMTQQATLSISTKPK